MKIKCCNIKKSYFKINLHQEQSFDIDILNDYVQINEPKLIPEQKFIFDRLMHAVAADEGGFFFLDAPGGTGKTFLISFVNISKNKIRRKCSSCNCIIRNSCNITTRRSNSTFSIEITT